MAPYVDFHTHCRRGDALEILNIDPLNEESFVLAVECGLPFSVGMHPWRTAENTERLNEAFERMDRVAQNGQAMAIGECGLDWSVDVDRRLQTEVFERQLELAKQCNLPVILHCVRAFEDVMSRLVRAKAERAVFHSFIGSTEQVARVVSKGYFCSFSPRSLASARTCEVIRRITPSALLIERDECECPIDEVYSAVAALRGCSIGELREIVFDNYKRLIDNE